MAKLKLRASSLIEVVVSSVIMLIAFAISMDTLVRLSTTKNNAEEAVRMEMDLRECIIGKKNPAEETRIYDWGKIAVTEQFIGNGLYRITYSITTRRQKKISFEKIVYKENEH